VLNRLVRRLDRVVALLQGGRHVGIQPTEPTESESSHCNQAQQNGSENNPQPRAYFLILPSVHGPSPLPITASLFVRACNAKLVPAMSTASLRAKGWEHR